MKFKGKKRSYQRGGGVAWHNQLPEVAVTGQAPGRNKYATASRGHQINTTHMAGYVDPTKTRAQIMAEARRNQEIERAAQEQDQINKEIADKEAALLDYNAQERITADPVRGVGVEGPRMPPITDPRGGNPARPVQGGGRSPQRPAPAPYTPSRPGLDGPAQSMNPNLPGPDDWKTAPIRPGTPNPGNTRGVVQRVLGGVGQFGGAAIDGVLNAPGQIVHGIKKGVHNLNHGAGRVVFGQTGETPAYPEYQRDETFQRAGRNTGETFGHALDKLSAIPYAAGASVIDGGINAVGEGIHNLNYGAGRVVFGQTGATPQYNRVNPAMQVVQGVYGLPGATYTEGVANSDTPTYGKMYGDGKGTSRIMDSVEASGQTQRKQVSKAQADARVTNAEKKRKAAETKKKKAEERAAAIKARKEGKPVKSGGSRNIFTAMLNKGNEFNKAARNRRGGRLNYLQQGGALPQEGNEISEEEVLMDFAVRYFTALGADDIVDDQGNLNPAYTEELTEVMNSGVDLEAYVQAPDEYIAQIVAAQNPQAVEIARKGAKLRKLRSIRFLIK